MDTFDRPPRSGCTPRRPSSTAGLFRTLVENSPDTIFLIDLETEQCIYVSPAVRSLLGREPEAMIGRPLTDFVHPDDTSELLARSAARRDGRGVRTAVTRMSHIERAWVWVQATGSPVVELEGRSTAVFTVTGASERVRAELGLRSAKLRLRRVLDQIGGGDRDGFLETRDGTYDFAIDALAAALELRDDETGQHARRVTDLALALTRTIDPELAAEPDLRYGFLLHDIGKIGVPDAILLKRGPLTEREAQVMQMHTALGEHLLALVPFVSDLAHDVVAFHHERWDGSGYPWGLRGTAIPLAARIFAIADAFDAMTSDRPYRRSRSVSAAIDEIEQGAGTQFDPTVVSVFVAMVMAGTLEVASGNPAVNGARL
jgi:PAS domain S-box-containing protein